MAIKSVDATSASLTITPAGATSSTIAYDSFQATLCPKPSGACMAAVTCKPAKGQPCDVSITGLTSGATYTATVVGVVGEATGLESAPLDVVVPFP